MREGEWLKVEGRNTKHRHEEVNNIKVETDGRAGVLIVPVAFDQLVSVVDDEGRVDDCGQATIDR